MIYRKLHIALVLIVLTACSETEEGDQNRVVGIEPLVTPVEKQVDGGALTAAAVTAPPGKTSKVFVIDMTVDSAGGVTLANPRLLYGEAPNELGNPPMFSAELFDPGGGLVDTSPLWDPRWTFVWNEEKNRDFVDLGDTGKGTIIMRFNAVATMLAVRRGKERVASLDLAETVARFCREYGDDPDCYQRPEPGEIR